MVSYIVDQGMGNKYITSRGLISIVAMQCNVKYGPNIHLLAVFFLLTKCVP